MKYSDKCIRYHLCLTISVAFLNVVILKKIKDFCKPKIRNILKKVSKLKTKTRKIRHRQKYDKNDNEERQHKTKGSGTRTPPVDFKFLTFSMVRLQFTYFKSNAHQFRMV